MLISVTSFFDYYRTWTTPYTAVNRRIYAIRTAQPYFAATHTHSLSLEVTMPDNTLPVILRAKLKTKKTYTCATCGMSCSHRQTYCSDHCRSQAYVSRRKLQALRRIHNS